MKNNKNLPLFWEADIIRLLAGLDLIFLRQMPDTLNEDFNGRGINPHYCVFGCVCSNYL